MVNIEWVMMGENWINGENDELEFILMGGGVIIVIDGEIERMNEWMNREKLKWLERCIICLIFFVIFFFGFEVWYFWWFMGVFL